MRKRSKEIISSIIDVSLSPITLLASAHLRSMRKLGLHRTPISRSIFQRLGVFPIVNHYYDPFIAESSLPDAELPRDLPGIDLNVDGQLTLLGNFNFQEELRAMPRDNTGALDFYFNNESFSAGDAELLYCMVRHLKPARIIEIGSGMSTLMSCKAISKNKEADPTYACKITCVEPFEMPWLENLPIEVIRERVEVVGTELFERLEPGDFLFIDSSHVIRPNGDVLFEYLQILPRIKPGVYVHIHDIFTPYDYPRSWSIQRGRLWNEQYLLEAFLTLNREFKVVFSINYMNKNQKECINSHFPVLSECPAAQPASFWMRRN